MPPPESTLKIRGGRLYVPNPPDASFPSYIQNYILSSEIDVIKYRKMFITGKKMDDHTILK